MSQNLTNSSLEAVLDVTRRHFLGRGAGLSVGAAALAQLLAWTGLAGDTVNDSPATVLHLLGIDHERLTHRFQGLDFKLTGVEPARVLTDIFA